ncbi:MAG: GrdX family protein [Lachnospiraceae bacterium]
MLRNKSQCLLVTNNDRVEKKYQGEMHVILLDTYFDVLTKVRDKSHEGYVLLTHPLAGSLKPNQTPYKSILMEMSEDGKIDGRSIELIEAAIETYHKFIELRELPNYAEKIKEDFKTIDLSLIENAF